MSTLPHVPAFRIVLNGVQAGQDVFEVAAKLAPTLKRNPAQVLELLDETDLVVKRGLDRPTAQHYLEFLEKSGCACVLEQDGAPIAPTATPQTAKAAPVEVPDSALHARMLELSLAQTQLLIAVLLGTTTWFLRQRFTRAYLILASLLILALAVRGLLRMGAGLNLSSTARALMLLNPIAMLRANARTVSELRSAGYTVGFIGVSAQDRDMMASRATGGKSPMSWLAWIALAAVFGGLVVSSKVIKLPGLV